MTAEIHAPALSAGAFRWLLPRLYHPETVNLAVRKPAA